MQQKRIFGNIKGGFSSVKEELKQARVFWEKAKSFFNHKKKGTGKSKFVFTKQMSFVIQNNMNEIENIIDMQEIDIDSFVLYRLRKSIENLQEKMDYIDNIEKL